jgi:hypothetical protein
LQSKNFPPDKRHPGHRSRYGKYGPRSGYGFLRTACQPIRIENFEKPYNNFRYYPKRAIYNKIRFAVTCKEYVHNVIASPTPTPQTDSISPSVLHYQIQELNPSQLSLHSFKFPIFCLSDDVEGEQQNQSSSGPQNGAQLNRISDVKTLDYLTRIYIMLARLVGRKSSHFTDYCLFAVACVQRIWKVRIYCSFSLEIFFKIFIME